MAPGLVKWAVPLLLVGAGVGCGQEVVSEDPCEKCLAPEHGVVRCIEGLCEYECLQGYDLVDLHCIPSASDTCCGAQCTNCTELPHADTVLCDGGTCVVLSCLEGYHALSGECEADAPDACGEAAVDCTALPHVLADEVECVEGACLVRKCAPGFHVESNLCHADRLDACGEEAKDCGAISNVATGGVACIDGKCVIERCRSGYHPAGEVCAADSAAECGAEPTDCRALPDVAPDGVACVDGVCVIERCRSSYHLAGGACLADSAAACGSAQNDCRTLPGIAEGGVACVDEACVVTSCAVDFHKQGNACQANSLGICGEARHNCTLLANVAPGGVACVEGACVVSRCLNNFHLKSNACEADRSDACGEGATDCRTLPDVASDGVACVDGACIIERCRSSYHLAGGACLADSAAACGSAQNDCRTLSGIAEGGVACVDAACVVTSCGVDFHKQGNACRANSLGICGEARHNCTFLANVAPGGVACVEGACVISSCLNNFHLKSNACEADRGDACGAAIVDCTAPSQRTPNALTMGCQNGICTPSACMPNYHVSGNICKADTLIECGALRTNCSRMPGTMTASCVEGECRAMGCFLNYHLDGYKCAADGTTACGAANRDCTASPYKMEHAAIMACVASACEVVECEPGYHLVYGTCREDTVTECGGFVNCFDYNKEGAKEVACVSGECRATRCNLDYGLVNGWCEPYSGRACGPTAIDCSQEAQVANAAEWECVNEKCALTACSPGHHSAWNRLACEPDSVDSCGKAFKDCTLFKGTAACVAGECQSAECRDGYLMGSDGCERIESLFSSSASPHGYCAVLERTHGLYCWGVNNASRFGIGNVWTGNYPNAMPVVGLQAGVKKVALGAEHACFLKEDGAVLCAGKGTRGRLGNSSLTVGQTEPEAVTDSIYSSHDWSAVDIAVGKEFSCALTAQERVKCWGGKEWLGPSATADSPNPVDVNIGPSGANVKQLAAGDDFACVLLTDGSVWCWGHNDYLQLGSDERLDAGTRSVRPIRAKLPQGTVARLFATNKTACAEMLDSAIVCWGANWQYTAGIDPLVRNALPTPMTYVESVSALSLGSGHTCVIQEGTLGCWGSGAGGALGVSRAVASPLVAPMPAMGAGVKAVAAGYQGTCAVASDGSAHCWGYRALAGMTNTMAPQALVGNGPPPDVEDYSGTPPYCKSGFVAVGTQCLWAACPDCASAHAGAISSCDYGSNEPSCEVLSCIPGYHRDADGCIQDTNQSCGDFSRNCEYLVGVGHVQVAACVWGICQAERCDTGYHIAENGTVCEVDTTARCGSLLNSCSDSNALSMSCSDGACRVDSCKSGFHKDSLGAACEPDSITACGSPSTSCVLMEGMANMESGTCMSGRCQGTPMTCAPGFMMGLQGCEETARIASANNGASANTYCSILKDTHALKCWGNNSYGKAGSSGAARSPRLVWDYGVQKVALGPNNSCLISDEGLVRCWGSNSDGQLGDGGASPYSSRTPIPLPGQDWRASDLAVGFSEICALTSVGGVICWGGGGIPKQPTALFPPGAGAVTLAGGAFHKCAGFSSGEIHCWGDNRNGAIGVWHSDGTLDASEFDIPRRVELLPNFEEPVSLVASVDRSCVLSRDGSAFCWGLNQSGEFGADSAGQAIAPRALTPAPSMSSLQLTPGYACAIMSETGTIQCRGYSYNGIFGSDITNSMRWHPVYGLHASGITFALGDNGVCALHPDGSVRCLGRNADGALGIGSTDNSFMANSPVAVLDEQSTLASADYGGPVTACHAGFRARTGGLSCLPENSITCCGDSCENCLDLRNAATSECHVDAGMGSCRATSCVPGHLLADHRCEP